MECHEREEKWNPSSLFFDTIIYNVLDGYKRNNKLKELLKNIKSLWSNCFLCEDMADFACKTRRAVSPSISVLRFRIIHRNEDNIKIFIQTQKWTAADQYSSSYGPAKIDIAMTSMEVETSRAVSSSILVFTCHIVHQNVDNYVIYPDANQDVDGVMAHVMVFFSVCLSQVLLSVHHVLFHL